MHLSENSSLLSNVQEGLPTGRIKELLAEGPTVSGCAVVILVLVLGCKVSITYSRHSIIAYSIGALVMELSTDCPTVLALVT